MPLDPVKYFEDLSKELRAVQNRIRQLIGDAYWPSDGAWKESVLRSIIRNYLPQSFTVGSGFILTSDGLSKQIDILVCDDSAPVFFRDGDFLVAPADCVRAVLEVKTSLDTTLLREALEKLNYTSALMRRRCLRFHPFLGLFCYESISTKPEEILNALYEANGSLSSYVIRALCFGDARFCRFWEYNPGEGSHGNYDSWHAYDLPQIAPGYFVHNIIEHLFPAAFEKAQKLWYPVDGKERNLMAVKSRHRSDSEMPLRQ
jgi:hypothetical protein